MRIYFSREVVILIFSSSPPISCPVCTPVSFSVCYADSFVLLSVLSNLRLQFYAAVVVGFFFIHVSLILCRTYPHLVFVSVFKYP